MKAFTFLLLLCFPILAVAQIPCGEDYTRNLASALKAYQQGQFQEAFDQFNALKGCIEGQKELKQLNAQIRMVLTAIKNDGKASSLVARASAAEKAGNDVLALGLAHEACTISQNGNELALQKREELLNKELPWLEKTLVGHSSYISFVAFSPDGQFVLTGSDDNTAQLWKLGGQEIRTFGVHSESVSSGPFSMPFPPGPSFNQRSAFATSVAFSSDGQFVLIGGRDKTAKLWNLEGKEIRAFRGHSDKVSSVAFSPDGQFILTGSWDKSAKLWNREGMEIRAFGGHSAIVTSVAFSPDGQFILTGSRDKAAKLWNLEGKEIRTFTGHSSDVSSVAFSPDGQFVLTGSYDKTAKLWNLEGKEIRTFDGHSDIVSSVAFSPDGQFILTGSEDQSAKLWKWEEKGFQSKQAVETYRFYEAVNALAFSTNGTLLIGAGNRHYLGLNLVKRLEEQNGVLTIAEKIREGLWSEVDCATTRNPDVLLGCVQYFLSKEELNRKYLNRAIAILDEAQVPAGKQKVIEIKEQLGYYLNWLYKIQRDSIQNVNQVKIAQNSIQALQQRLAQHPGDSALIFQLAEKYGYLAFSLILTKQPALQAIEAAQQGLTLAPTKTGIITTLALGHLFNGEWAKAQQIYQQWMDVSWATSGFDNDVKTFREAFLYVLDVLEAAGVSCPDLPKARALLEGKKQ